MNRAQKAAEYHQKGYNCAQAIVCAFCDKVGLDEKTAFKVSEGLGLGVSDTYGTCGAVTGMALVMGMANSCGNLEVPTSKAATSSVPTNVSLARSSISITSPSASLFLRLA